MSVGEGESSRSSRASSTSSTGAVDYRWPWELPSSRNEYPQQLFPRFNQLVEIGRELRSKNPELKYLDLINAPSQIILASNAESFSVNLRLPTDDYEFCSMYQQDFDNFISGNWSLFINGKKIDINHDEEENSMSLMIKMFEVLNHTIPLRSENFVDIMVGMQQMNMTELLRTLKDNSQKEFDHKHGITGIVETTDRTRYDSLSQNYRKLRILIEFFSLNTRHIRFDLTYNSDMIFLKTTCSTYLTVMTSSGIRELDCFAVIPLITMLDLSPENLLRPNAFKLSGHEEIMKNLMLCYTTIEKYFSDTTVIERNGTEINLDGLNKRLCEEIKRPAREAEAEQSRQRVEAVKSRQRAEAAKSGQNVELNMLLKPGGHGGKRFKRKEGSNLRYSKQRSSRRNKNKSRRNKSRRNKSRRNKSRRNK